MEAGKEMLSAFSVFLTNQSYMQQMANLVDALQGKSNAGRKIIASGVQQHIPYDAMLGWVERMMNKYEKSPIDFKQEVIKSLPIMEKWVMPKQDPNTLQYVKSTTSFRGGVKQGLMGALLPGKVVPFNRATDNEYKQKQKEQLLNAIIKNREMQRAYNEYLKRTRTQ